MAAADVRRAVRARPEWGPACESSSARDVEMCVSTARSSQAVTSCHGSALPAAQVAVPVRRVRSSKRRCTEGGRSQTQAP